LANEVFTKFTAFNAEPKAGICLRHSNMPKVLFSNFCFHA
jgi:hypothetical protein